MNMIKPSLLALALASVNAQAGIFDFFKSSDEPSDTQVEAAKTEVSQAQQQAQTTVEQAQEQANQTSNSTLDLASSLIPQLSSGLSINQEQASGGLGALMQYAKASLSEEQGQQLSNGIPGLDSLIAAAPALAGDKGGLAGSLGQIGSAVGGALGDGASAAGALGMLTQQFESLGLSPEMIGQMAQMAMQFFSSNEPATGGLLEQALGSLLK